VISRFALDPRWLLYLPPTMAPCATSQLPDVLERPAEAFDAYRADGIAQVICEQKHMGSRAIALIRRDARVAQARFGTTGEATGAVYTRTGRPFFNPELTRQLLDRLRGAVTESFNQAYRRYCWPTEGLAGIRLAPFQILASHDAGSRCVPRPGG
jgi:protein phosphatase